MIYRVNYRSEDLHIKGYLGLPPELPAALSHSMAAEADGLHDVTIMETLACSILNTGTNVSESSIDLVWEADPLPRCRNCHSSSIAVAGSAVWVPSSSNGLKSSQHRDMPYLLQPIGAMKEPRSR